MKDNKWCEPKRVFEEYEKQVKFKTGLGDKGLYEQSRMNERFLAGDQWRGAECGNERPLVRHNIIKRIGDYKMTMLGGQSIAVNYTAEGVPNTKDIKERVRKERERLRMESEGSAPLGTDKQELPAADQINLVMSAMSDYFKTTAERVKLDDLKIQVLKQSYISGTGILYTYWDERLKTGLYADEGRTSPIMGDIRCETLNVENVYFGDPNMDSVQEQPYILIARRRKVEDIRRDAKRYGASKDKLLQITADSNTENEAGDLSQDEPTDAEKAVEITKLYKEWNEDGTDYRILAVTVVKGTTIRPQWDIGVKVYPIAKINWETRRNCVYGESEITYLVPNQIAINRALTAEIWSGMTTGMPITLVNGDAIPFDITNEPGMVYRVFGEDINNAIQYVYAKGVSPQFDAMVNNLIGNTLTQSGANDAALGNMKPDNTSAIIAVREAATMPMQLLQNRFYSFVEDVARIWAEFWTRKYGRRSLKVEDDSGEWYMPFDGEQYCDLMITARVDVGAGTMWSELQSVKTLDNLYGNKVIDVEQYLERLPKGSVPRLGELLREIQEKRQAAEQHPPTPTVPPQGGITPGGIDPSALAQLMPEEYKQKYSQLTPEQRNEVAMRMM